MATYTGNLNLKKPSLDDDALITDINNNMDILDAAANGIEDALAIVANGNTHAAITSGQFVYVRNHSTLTEGLYVASSNIAANATLSSSNLTADSKGGLNALSEQIANYITVDSASGTTDADGYINVIKSSQIIILKAWSTSSDVLVFSYPATSATEKGRESWWFRAVNSTSLASKANTSITIYYAYITK